VEKYEARHPLGTKPRLALDLLMYTGVRHSDLVKLGPQMQRDGKLHFTEIKGRGRIVKHHALPILPPLRASIDATLTGHLVYLATPNGTPHSAKAFGGWFKRRCQEAGLEVDLSAHGLRKLGATRAADNGATEYELMAIFGWSSSKLAGLYTRKANRARLEAGAAPLLMRADSAQPIRNEIGPLSAAPAPGGPIRAKTL
jgi:integrase